MQKKLLTGILCLVAALAAPAVATKRANEAQPAAAAAQPAPEAKKGKGKEKKVLDPDLMFQIGVAAGHMRGNGFVDESG